MVVAPLRPVEPPGAWGLRWANRSPPGRSGTAALIVAARQPVQGVVTLSAPVEFEGLSAKDAVTKVMAPKLFIGAEDDAGGPAARELGGMGPEPKEVAVFPGSAP